MFGDKKVVLKADLAGVERQLQRLGDLFEVYLTQVHSVDLLATTSDMPVADLERSDDMTPEQQEFLAAIEMLEDDGVQVPTAAYKKLGLDAPNKEDEPTEFEVNRPQPGSEPLEEPDDNLDEPTTAIRKDKD